MSDFAGWFGLEKPGPIFNQYLLFVSIKQPEPISGKCSHFI